jgi:hypothetical protein
VIIDLTVDGSEVLAKSLATEVRKIKAYEDAVKESKKIYTILNPSLLEEKTQASDNLRMHPIQKSFIDRALMQLKDQLTYLRDKAHKEELNLDEPVQKLEKIIEILGEVLYEKTHSDEGVGNVAQGSNLDEISSPYLVEKEKIQEICPRYKFT